MDAFTQDPLLRFTTSFLQEVVAEGCRHQPSPWEGNEDAAPRHQRLEDDLLEDLRREEL